MICVQLYGKWARWGRYNLYFEALIFTKTRTLFFFFFFLIFAENVIPEHN